METEAVVSPEGDLVGFEITQQLRNLALSPGDYSVTESSAHQKKKNAEVNVPISIIIQHILPYLNRTSFNSLCQTTKELHNAIFKRANSIDDDDQRKIGSVSPPWPSRRWKENDDRRGSVQVVAFSSDDRFLASGSHKGPIHLVDKWNGNTIKLLEDSSVAEIPPGLTRSTYYSDVQALAFSKDKRWMASGGGDLGLRLWDLRDLDDSNRLEQKDADSSSKTFECRCRCHQLDSDETVLFGLDFSADSRLLATSGYNATISIYQLPQGKIDDMTPLPKTVREPVYTVSRAPSTLLVGAYQADNNVQNEFVDGIFWGSICDVRFSSNGKSLVAAGDDGIIYQWSVESREVPKNENDGQVDLGSTWFANPTNQTESIENPSPASTFMYMRLVRTYQDDSDMFVNSILFSPCQRYIWTAGACSVLQQWEISTGLRTQWLEVPYSASHGFVLMTSFMDWQQQPDDVAKAALTPRTVDFLDGTSCIAISPNGKILASAGLGGWIILWNLPHMMAAIDDDTDSDDEDDAEDEGDDRMHQHKDNQSFVLLDQTPKAIHSLAFSEDGHVLASCCGDGSTRTYEISFAVFQMIP